jgi:general secretion pathway protein D
MSIVQNRVGLAISAAALLLLIANLSNCSKFDTYDKTNLPSDVVASTDLSARFAPRLPQPRFGDTAQPAQVYPGSPPEADAPSHPTAEGATLRPGEGYDLNFNNAEISAVAKALLGDALGVNYAIDPRVQGTLSLNSGRPVAKNEILPLLESVLKFAGATLVKEGPVYKIVPSGEEIGAGSTNVAGSKMEPGNGITVVPLRYVAAPTVLKALDSFAAKPGMLRADAGRNVLLIMGTSTERASAVEAALALDVNWMKNQSVGIFPVRNASPETIITELQNVFDTGKEGAAANLVRFQPIVRLNAVLAVAQTPSTINEVKTWVARLDRTDNENTTVRVYRIRYGKALLMASVLREVFTGQTSGLLGTTAQADLSQLTPGSSLQRSTSTGTQSGLGSTSTSSSSSMGTARPPIPGQPTTSSGFGQQQQQSQTGARLPTELGATSSTGSQQPLLPNVRITADTTNNSLLIYANRDQYKIIERAIFELDKAPLQVAIDVTVAEISLTNELQFGVQFYLNGGDKLGTISFGTSNAVQTISPALPGFNALLGATSNPRVVLNALRKITDVKVLSNPSLVVLDNQQAMLQVGDQVPISTQQASSVLTPDAPLVNTVQMQDTGVILKVVPRVNANGSVTLDMSQEISNVVNPSVQTLTPTISKRVIQSSIAVQSGQTVLIGGLIMSHVEHDKSGIPFLSEIKGPIGDLFGSKDDTNVRTELIIFIRPQIIRDGVDAQLVAEELRSKLTVLGRGQHSAPLRPRLGLPLRP